MALSKIFILPFLLLAWLLPSIKVDAAENFYQSELEKIGFQIAEKIYLPSDKEIHIFDQSGSQIKNNSLLTDQPYFFSIPDALINKPIYFLAESSSQDIQRIIVSLKGPNNQNLSFSLKLDNTQPYQYSNLTKGKYELKINKIAQFQGIISLKILEAAESLNSGAYIITPETTFKQKEKQFLADHLREKKGDVIIIGNNAFASQFQTKFNRNPLNKPIIPSQIRIGDLRLDQILPSLNPRQIIFSDKKVISSIVSTEEKSPNIVQPLMQINSFDVFTRIFFYDQNFKNQSIIYAISPEILNIDNSDTKEVILNQLKQLIQNNPKTVSSNESNKNTANYLNKFLIILVIFTAYLLYFPFILTLKKEKKPLWLIFQEKKAQIKKIIRDKILPIIGIIFALSFIFLLITKIVINNLIDFYKKYSGLDLISNQNIDEITHVIFDSPIYYVLFYSLIAILLIINLLIIWVNPNSLKSILVYFEFEHPIQKIKKHISIPVKKIAIFLFALLLSLLSLTLTFQLQGKGKLLWILPIAIVIFSLIYYILFIYNEKNDQDIPFTFKQKIVYLLLLTSFALLPLKFFIQGIYYFAKESNSNITEYKLDIGALNDDQEANVIYIRDQKPFDLKLKQSKFEKIANFHDIGAFINRVFDTSPQNVISQKIQSKNGNYRLYNGDTSAFIIIPNASHFLDKQLNLLLSLKSPVSINLIDLNEKSYLLYDPLFQEITWIGEFENLNIYKTQKAETSDEFISKKKNYSLKSFLKENLPIDSITYLQPDQSFKGSSDDIKKILIKDVDSNESLNHNIILNPNLIALDYTFYTALSKTFSAMFKINTQEISQTGTIDIDLVIQNKLGEIVNSQHIKQQIDGKSENIIKSEIPSLNPGVYKISLIHRPDSFKNYYISEIALNSPKLVVEGEIRVIGSTSIYLKNFAENILLTKENGESQNIKLFPDKGKIYQLKMPPGITTVYAGHALIAFEEASWFNPYSVNFSDSLNHAEYIITNQKINQTFQNGWIMIQKELPSRPFMDNKGKLVFEISPQTEEKNPIFLDMFQIHLATPTN